MHAARARSPLQWLTLLCSAAAVRGALTNYTLDDTNPAIVYTQPPLIRCAPNVSCDPDWVAGLYNGTSSVTGSPIVVSFTGSAVYVYLGITGSCLFNLDGRTVGEFIDTIGSDANTMHLAFHNASMPDVPHVLVIYPAEAGLYVQLDRVVYTHETTKKSHLAAILGGVLGGLAFAVILTVTAFFVRRREQRRRVSMRGVPLYDYWPDKPKTSSGGDVKLSELAPAHAK